MDSTDDTRSPALRRTALGPALTIPHEVEVLRHLDEIAPDARLIGENTDGRGFLRSLQAVPIDPRGRRVVILGADGAWVAPRSTGQDRVAGEVVSDIGWGG